MSQTIQVALDGWRAGSSLPQPFYADAEVFALDRSAIFATQWLFVGHSVDVREPGDYLSVTIGQDPIIVLRGDDGVLRIHHNVCRHRGSRLLPDGRGHLRSIVCPYHQWSYGLDGELRRARSMGDGFCTADWPLRSAAVEELAGMVFACIGDDPPPFADARAAIEPQLEVHGWDRAVVAARLHYTVAANWKLIVENNRERYHCRGGHPEFCITNFDLGVDGDDRVDEEYRALVESSRQRWTGEGMDPRVVSFPDGQFFRVARLPLRPGCVTESLDGRQVAPLMGRVTNPDSGSLRLIGLPNMWGHANCDYGMTTRLLPTGPTTTDVEVTFLVAEGAVADADYRLDDVTAVWRATSEQDWLLCENNQAGINSSAYRPGPYSPSMERSVELFTTWYLDLLGAGATSAPAAS